MPLPSRMRAGLTGCPPSVQIWGLLPMDYYHELLTNPEKRTRRTLWVSPAVHLPSGRMAAGIPREYGCQKVQSPRK